MTYDLDKIRIKCAELVGWTEIGSNGYGFNPIPRYLLPGEKLRAKDPLPNFPVSADAALQLVEWMAKPENGGYNYRACDTAVFTHGFGFVNDEHSFEATAPTLPLAICLAFLRVNKVNLEDL
jgi:hypothetical protein